jgi:hypothetical protein
MPACLCTVIWTYPESRNPLVASLGEALALLSHIELRWKWNTSTNALTYNTMTLIDSGKSFIVKAPVSPTIKDGEKIKGGPNIKSD